MSDPACPICLRTLLQPAVAREPHCRNRGCPWIRCRCGAVLDLRGGVIPAPRKARKK